MVGYISGDAGLRAPDIEVIDAEVLRGEREVRPHRVSLVVEP